MRRSKNSANIIVFSLLPVVVAISWVASRILSKRRTRSHARMPISGVPSNTSFGTSKTLPEDRLWEIKETGFKQPGQETSSPDRSKTAPPEPDAGRPTETADHDEAAPAQRREPLQDINAAGLKPRSGHALENRDEGFTFTTMLVLLVPFLILVAAIVLLAFNHTPVQSQVIVPGGDANSGRAALQSWGCGSCHTISGVPGANGKVGPALNDLANRSFIAGHLENTPENMMLWIMHPQQVSPGTDMPDTGVPASVARDMAAYLYSIK